MSRQIRSKGGHLSFPIGPRNTYWVDDIEILVPVLLNSVQRFQRSRKCLSLSEARATILVFRSARKHKLDKGYCEHASCYR